MRKFWVWGPWLFFGFALFCFTTLSVDVSGQLVFAVLVITTLIILKRVPPHYEVVRYGFLFLAIFSSVRYFVWRTTATLTGFVDLWDVLGTAMLYLAEVYSISILLLSTFTNIRPVTPRPIPVLPRAPDKLPTVDVMIPAYDEPLEMLEISLIAALNLRYPADRFKVYMLDDGSSEARRHHQDSEIARIANERFAASTAMCEQLGVTLLTRTDNRDAKAGNINAAMAHTRGDLILILDADHVATVDLLEKTVGFFLEDPKMAIVQTPHFFINSDPVEKNLQLSQRLPSESEMFYFVVQPGLDSWGSTFFCGSAGLILRKALEDIGGFSARSITEDADTSLLIHAEGYRSAYVSHPMISGLQPESYTGFIRQRTRWAQGMIQILILDNPLFKKGLTLPERLCYFSNVFFWLFPYARVAFILSPMLYLVFGFKIYNADLRHFLAFALPHIVVVFILSDYLYGKVRWTFASELYELMQATFALPAIFRTFQNPKTPTFKVTPKAEFYSDDYLSRLSFPFYILYFCTLLAIGFGIWRFAVMPAERSMVVVTMLWAMLNWLNLNGAIGALFERRQRRTTPRMPADIAGALVADEVSHACHVVDLSTYGALVMMTEEEAEALPEAVDTCQLRVFNRVIGRDSVIRVQIRNRRLADDGLVAIGLRFELESLPEKTEAVLLAHGDSDRWKQFLGSKIVHPGFFQSFLFFSKLGLKHAGEHFAMGLRLLLSRRPSKVLTPPIEGTET